MFLKAFIRLFLAVVIPLFIIVFPLDNPILSTLSMSLWQERIDNTYKGTFSLIEKRLLRTPQNQWQQEFTQISDLFPYPIYLRKRTDLQQQAMVYNCLQEPNNYCAQEEDDLAIVYKSIANTEFAVEMYLDYHQEDDIRLGTVGTAKLIAEYFREAPQEQWHNILSNIKKDFGFDIKIIDPSTLELTTSQRKRLDTTHYLSINDEQDNISIYHQLPNNRPLLLLGPIPLLNPNLTIVIAVFGTLLIAISLGLMLFVYLLSRDIKKLTRVATHFGKGHLTQRSNVSKRAILGPLASSFDSMADRIQSTITSQRDLTNAIAHDLRTPLSRLSFALEMIDTEDLSAVDKARYCQSMANSIDTLDHLIKQMLVLARYTRAADINHFSQSNICQLLSSEMQYYRYDYPHLQFKLDIPQALQDTVCLIDQRAMSRALSNIINNAIRYTNSKIVLRLHSKGSLLCISIDDDGPGIPNDQRKNVFKPFIQLDNATRDKDTEHGLGLAIVKQIAQWHQGHVSISDAQIGGASISFCWPMK
jgi:two-component system sensor histidine kinase RstB